MENVRYPVQVIGGRLQEASDDQHVEQMIEQVLFTRQGERVNRPDFGCSLQLAVFEPGNSEVVAATQALIRAQLQKYLGDLIVVERATVTVLGPTLTVTIQYIVLATRERRVQTFQQ